jgi:hypothetical protein
MSRLHFFCLFVILSAVQTNSIAQLVKNSQELPVKFAPVKTYTSGGWSAESVAVSDLNGDGHLDVVVANGLGSDSTYGEVSVLLGNGNGTFQPAVSYSSGVEFAQSVAIGDVNGDGKPDLVLSNLCDINCDGEVSVLLGNGDGTFQPAVTYNSGGSYAWSVAIGDLNGDGIPDLVVANQYQSCCGGDSEVGVLIGNGDGTFQPAVTYNSGGSASYSVAIGDVNGDGIPDLLVTNECNPNNDCQTGSVGVLLGNGDGTFRAAVTYDSLQAYFVTIGDVNGDGKPDLVVANYGGSSVSVLLGNGDGTFQPGVTYYTEGDQAESVAIGDVNGDGKPDLVVANYCFLGKHGDNCEHGSVSLMLGNGDGTFQAPVIFSSGGVQAESVAIGDVNSDGKPDVLVTNRCGPNDYCTNGTVGILLNKTSSATTTTALTSSPNPSQINESVTLTATVASALVIANGETIAFYDGKTELGTGTTTNGIATLTTSFSKAGKHTIKATYPGDAFHKASSGTVKQVVNQ